MDLKCFLEFLQYIQASSLSDEVKLDIMAMADKKMPYVFAHYIPSGNLCYNEGNKHTRVTQLLKDYLAITRSGSNKASLEDFKRKTGYYGDSWNNRIFLEEANQFICKLEFPAVQE